MKMPMNDFEIKTASQSDMQTLSDWALKEGWNPGLYDAENYFVIDPEGFLIGYLGEKPIACISAVRYSEKFGFIGFYIVHPDFRGKGYGMQIWKAGMKRLRDCRTVGLDGVVDQQSNYKKSGFVYAGQHTRYATQGGGAISLSSSLTDLKSIPIDPILDCDKDLFPSERSTFLKTWINQPQAVSLGKMTGDQLTGYGVMRPCHEGYKIGPLFADDSQTADEIFIGLKCSAPYNTTVYLDAPHEPHALSLVNRHSMESVFETARMYFGPAPKIPTDRIYGVTSLEVG